MKVVEKYELSLDVVSSVSMAGTKLRKDNSQIVEEALRRDPLIAEMIKMQEGDEDMPDYDPKRAEKVPRPRHIRRQAVVGGHKPRQDARPKAAA